MGKNKPQYWNDDTMSFSWKGVDYVAGDIIPAAYQEAEPERFEMFCENGQISDKKNVTFSEKQTASLVNSRNTVDKLRDRLKEQTIKIKGLEKKVEDFEVSFDELSDLDTGKEEIKKLKAELVEAKKNVVSLDEFAEESEKVKYLTQIIEEMEKTWTAPVVVDETKEPGPKKSGGKKS